MEPLGHTRRCGKTDTIDAEAAACKVLSGEATVTPKDTTGTVEAIPQPQVARRTAAGPDVTQLHEPVHTARFALSSVARRSVAFRRELAASDTDLDTLIGALLHARVGRSASASATPTSC